jgi:hypothetical protein
MTYGGGPVMAGRVHVYVIWYGSIPSFTSTQSIVDYFINNWGASHSYGVLRSYTGTNGRVAPELTLAGESLDSGSRGTKLADSDIQALVANAITSGTFPSDTNGIYLVIVGTGVSIKLDASHSICGNTCGYHSLEFVNGAHIKYSAIGSGNCTNCQLTLSHSPNGNQYADSTVNTITHEVAETVTDPEFNGWGPSNNEVGDKCNWNFSEQHNAANGVPATARVGMNYYTIQKLWTITNGGQCYSGYSPPAAVIWQNGPGGAIAAWKMKDENTVSSYISYNNLPTGQNVLAVGDFSNGIDPQILTIPSGNIGAITMTTLHSDGTFSSAATSFNEWDAIDNKIVSTGDFNGDGFGDILAVNQTNGYTWLYLMQGPTLVSQLFVGSAYPPYLPQGGADLNGDGLADILWVDNADRFYTFWTSSVSSTDSTNVWFTAWNTSGFQLPFMAVGDSNGDSRADVLYYPRSDGAWLADAEFIADWQPNTFIAEGGGGDLLPYYPGPWNPPFAGLVDVNRDGAFDLYFQGPAGIQFARVKDWKTGWFFTNVGIAHTGPSFSDSGWTVVGTGGFKE